ncbi:MAG: prepilin-type N-terminal cleavage/methylation domain-containing protein [Lentisphaeria bacterium]|nr:prepilin-type N-terminal cleavage/methylation domain-containing protein [Lentisphaeria bacterium]
MKKNLFRSGFNLIEVTMAIAIVGIGIAGVMALFPPAIEANKTANFQNFTGTVVNNVAAYLDYQLKFVDGWNTFKGKYKEKDETGTTKSADILTQTNTDIDAWGQVDNFVGLFHPVDNSTIKARQDWFGLKFEDGSIAAHVRIWKITSSDKGYFGGSSEEITFGGNRLRLVIELSWPVAKAYADREKQEFVYDFYNPLN